MTPNDDELSGDSGPSTGSSDGGDPTETEDETESQPGTPPRVTDGELLDAVETADRGFRTTGELADEFGYEHSHVYRRLQRLADEGSLEKTLINDRVAVWVRVIEDE